MPALIDINCQLYATDTDALANYRRLAASPDVHAFVVSAIDLKLSYSADFPFMSLFATPNEATLHLAEAVNSEKLLPFCFIDPTERGADSQVAHWIDKRGFKGVKMYPPRGWHVDDPRALAVFTAAQELNVPVFLHMGRTAVHPQLDSNYARPLRLERVGITCPCLRLIIGHFAAPWSREAMDIALGFPNFVFDLSTSGAWDIALLKLTTEIADLGVRRLIYGSNGSATISLSGAAELERKLLESGFTPEQCRAIFLENALQFLNLIPLPALPAKV